MNIISKGQFTEATNQERYISYLSQAKNIEYLMPEEKVEDFKVYNPSACTFKIKGIADFGMKIEELTSEKLIYGPFSKVPFSFKLTITFERENNLIAPVLNFQAEVSKVMEMMLKSPLTNLFDNFITKLEKQY